MIKSQSAYTNLHKILSPKTTYTNINTTHIFQKYIYITYINYREVLIKPATSIPATVSTHIQPDRHTFLLMHICAHTCTRVGTE